MLNLRADGVSRTLKLSPLRFWEDDGALCRVSAGVKDIKPLLAVTGVVCMAHKFSSKDRECVADMCSNSIGNKSLCTVFFKCNELLAVGISM